MFGKPSDFFLGENLVAVQKVGVVWTATRKDVPIIFTLINHCDGFVRICELLLSADARRLS